MPSPELQFRQSIPLYLPVSWSWSITTASCKQASISQIPECAFLIDALSSRDRSQGAYPRCKAFQCPAYLVFDRRMGSPLRLRLAKDRRERSLQQRIHSECIPYLPPFLA